MYEFPRTSTFPKVQVFSAFLMCIFRLQVRPDQAKIKKFSMPDFNDSTLFTTTSVMTFELPTSFNRIRLKCIGNVFDIYSEASVFEITRTPPRGSTSSLSSSDSVLPSTISASRGKLNLFQECKITIILQSRFIRATSQSTEILFSSTCFNGANIVVDRKTDRHESY